MTVKPVIPKIINAAGQIRELVDQVVALHGGPEVSKPTMYIDLEGEQLSREGTISIFTLLLDTGDASLTTYLIDVHQLGAQAFDTAGTQQNLTLKDILQDARIPKAFWDVRNDSDALFALFGVALQGVVDIQLMENAARATTKSRRFVGSLENYVQKVYLGGSVFASGWGAAKVKGKDLFDPDRGGSFEALNERPMSDDIVSYCVGDVQVLPELWNRLHGGDESWLKIVGRRTEERVIASQEPNYQPVGTYKSLAPWSPNENDHLNYLVSN
ncbi:hypothetical protein BT63DRAFT_408955 [Microthyrium microscopicum]|uniref:3'-5' exonuclease domain-containing protein n=1 Tax=Microthyrium microscopicum TaxID=703497 RepID=A0A6A6UTJ8_9PEZI|nr:hypothetical protein BT63DRAFT_408955 [Microthyrium microscopicum]